MATAGSSRDGGLVQHAEEDSDGDGTIRYGAEEEAEMVTCSNTLKTSANSLFTMSDFDGAVSGYEKALAALPAYLDFEIALLRSNMAACYLKMEQWKRCADEAGHGLSRLDDLDRASDVKPQSSGGGAGADRGKDNADPQENTAPGHATQIMRIRTKLLLRRAKAKSEMGGWAELQAAHEDYKLLDSLPSLQPNDRNTVQQALRQIPPRLDAAKEQEMGEMMGKLKQLGNGFLKPFGLSTDNFKMVKDEKSGGYNMSFSQNG